MMGLGVVRSTSQHGTHTSTVVQRIPVRKCVNINVFLIQYMLGLYRTLCMLYEWALNVHDTATQFISCNTI